jgi:WD40 repeat protein
MTRSVQDVEAVDSLPERHPRNRPTSRGAAAMSAVQKPRSRSAGRPSALVFVGLWAVLIVGLSDRSARAADEVRRLEGQTDQLTSMALSPDGKLLVTGSDDKTLRLWQFESGQELRTLRGSATFVLSVAISADGRRVSVEGLVDEIPRHPL